MSGCIDTEIMFVHPAHGARFGELAIVAEISSAPNGQWEGCAAPGNLQFISILYLLLCSFIRLQ